MPSSTSGKPSNVRKWILLQIWTTVKSDRSVLFTWEEGEEEDTYASNLSEYPPHFILFDVELVYGRHLYLVRLVTRLRLLPDRSEFEKLFFNRRTKFFQFVVAVRTQFEQLRDLITQ